MKDPNDLSEKDQQLYRNVSTALLNIMEADILMIDAAETLRKVLIGKCASTAEYACHDDALDVNSCFNNAIRKLEKIKRWILRD